MKLENILENSEEINKIEKGLKYLILLLREYKLNEEILKCFF